MKVNFFGCRGSIPRSHPDLARYGGNTPCVEVTSSSGHIFILDMGTGAVDLGVDLIKRMKQQANGGGANKTRGTVLITHTHWDHIQGFPFFAPFFIPGFSWEIYGPKGLSGSFEDTLAGQMQHEYFPVTMSQLTAEVNCHDLFEGSFKTKGVTVKTHYLNHTVLTLGYRLESRGVALAYITDHEPYDHGLAVEGYHRSPEESPKTDDDRHVDFFMGVDLLIHDCQYTAKEYGQGKAGWGHSTVEYVVDIAMAAGVKQLALFHHDPNRTDAQVDDLVEVARERALKNTQHGDGKAAPLIFAAAEGMKIDLQEDTSSSARRISCDSAKSIHLVNGITIAAENVVACLDCSSTFAETLKEELDKDNLIVHLCKNFESLLSVVEQKRPSVVVMNQYNPEGSESALDICCDIRRMMGEWGLRVAFFIIAKDQAELEKGRARNIVAVDNWITPPLSVDYLRTRIRMNILRSQCRWEQPPIPKNEFERLQTVRDSCLLDIGSPESLSRIGRIARQLFDVTVVAFSVLDEDKIKFITVESVVGFGGLHDVPREDGICSHIISTNDLLVVNDTLKDERFARSPHVVGEPFIRFFAGVPISIKGNDGDDYVIGAMSLLDVCPRKLDLNQIKLLKDLSSIVDAEFCDLSVKAQAMRNN
ncbi:hypothetical protein ACHAW6_011806 [Cyclotella cf. meneghiniana]